MDHLLQQLLGLGCSPVDSGDAQLRTVERDRCAPEDFYSTTNHRTLIRHGQQWLEVENQRMDALVVVADGHAVCRRLRDIRAGDQVVAGMRGIRVVPGIEGARPALLRLHVERHLLRAPTRNRRAPDRRAAAAGDRAEAGRGGGRRAGGGPHRRRTAACGPDPQRIRAGAAERQCPGRARRGSGAARHLARRAHGGRPPGRARPSQSHARHQHHLSLRQCAPGRGKRLPSLRHPVRVREEQRALRAGRQPARRRPAARHHHRYERGAGRLRRST